MSEINRRTFLKGAGKTLLTGATLGAVGMSGGSTTPLKTVAPATTWKNLNVLSPKAKAYRGFLKGLLGGVWKEGTGWRSAGTGKGVSKKTILTKFREYNPKTGNIEKVKTSYGRKAFETAIKKPIKDIRPQYGGVRPLNFAATNIALDMKNKISSLSPFSSPPYADPKKVGNPKMVDQQTNRLTAQITKGARKYHADELRKFRQANPERMDKKVSAKTHKENVKAKSKGGGMMGGGKFIEGMETPRNPTGISLLTLRSVLM